MKMENLGSWVVFLKHVIPDNLYKGGAYSLNAYSERIIFLDIFRS